MNPQHKNAVAHAAALSSPRQRLVTLAPHSTHGSMPLSPKRRMQVAVAAILGLNAAEKGGARLPLRGSTFFSTHPPLTHTGQELCERLAYYSISTNLVERLLALGMAPAAASAQATAWSATAYLVAILGAYAADALFGRFTVILSGMLLYVAGLAGLVGVTAANASAGATLATLYVIALATGGIKASVAPFGAAQILDAPVSPSVAASAVGEAPTSTTTPSRAERDAAVGKYFNFFYLSINVGALIASLAIVNIETSVSWAAGYSVALAACAAALMVFVAASGLYVRQPPTHARGGADPLAALARVVAATWRARRQAVPPPEAVLHEHPALLSNAAPDGRPRALRTPFLPWLDRAAVVVGDEDGGYTPPTTSPGIGVTDVEDVKRVVAYLVLSIPSIVFWLAYSQMQSALLLVGDQLNRALPGTRVTLSSGTLSTFNTLTIVALLPLYDGAVTLATRRRATAHTHKDHARHATSRRCRPLPCVIARVLAGHVITIVAMLSAVPPARAAAAAVASATPPAARPSVFTLAAPFALVGAAEVGASVGMLELAFSDAPHGARSLLQAVQLLCVALGSYLASAFTAAVEAATTTHGRASWIPATGQPGRLDLYFLVLAGVAAVNAAVFGGLALWYRPRRLAEDDDDGDDDGLELQLAAGVGH